MKKFKGFLFELDKSLIRPMLAYSLPILLISLVGMVNEVADKILIKYLTPIPDVEFLQNLDMTGEEYALQQLGIYGANFKLAVLMTIFIQMFRYASEPFFFGKAKDRNAPELYAKVMTYFVIFCQNVKVFVCFKSFLFLILIRKCSVYKINLHIL